MKIWAFRVLAAVLPSVVLLLGLEAVLRALGSGDSLSFAHSRRLDGTEVWVNNPRFGRLFFPPQLSRACLPFRLEPEATDPSLRVFLLGGSAAMGIPDPAYGMGRMLEEMLRHEFEGVEVEVINTAITAINSHVVFQIARACTEMSPDLFVVYMGNNEVVGPYGAGTILSPMSGHVSWIRLGLSLRSTRLGQWMNGLLRDDTKLPTTWRGMAMFRDNQITADDPRLDTVYANFERNLRDLLRLSAERDIPTAVGTVGVNLRDSAPFGSQSTMPLDPETQARFDDHWAAALTAPTPEAALAAVDAALALDDTHAEAHYRRARWLEKTGDINLARLAYERARDLDTLRFRHDSILDESLRSTVREFETRGIQLVDTAAALDAASPNGIPGKEMLFEHVHLTPAGNYQVARAFFETVRHLVPDDVAVRAKRQPALALAETYERIALTEWDQHRLWKEIAGMLTSPPFPDQSSQPQAVAHVTSVADTLAAGFGPAAMERFASAYQSAMTRDSSWMVRYRWGGFLLNAGLDPVAAERVFREIVAYLPQFPAAHNELASALASQGKSESAASVLRRSLDIDPFQPSVYNNLASCLLHSPAGMEEAVEHLAHAVALDPNPNFIVNWNVARHQWSEYLASRGDSDRAMTVLREILLTEPEDPQAHFNLATLLVREGQLEAARPHAQEVLRQHPENPQAQALWEQVRP